MKKVLGSVAPFLILLSILLSPNCATVTRSSRQRIPVTSSPAGAKVIVNGVEQGVTPLEVRLARKDKGQIIRIESPGYNPVEIRPQRKMSGSTILSDFLLGLIPAIVPAGAWGLANEDSDSYGSGMILTWMLGAAAFGGLFTLVDSGSKGYMLDPKELIVTLTKVDGTPRVDTMLVDAADLQNVKWIRVHRE